MDPVRLKTISPADIDALSPEQQFALVDSSSILSDQQNSNQEPSAPSTPSAPTVHSRVIRFPSHPYHTDEQWSQLLPHELHALSTASAQALHLIGCSFSSVSGWPQTLDRVSELYIKGSLPSTAFASMAGMPEMPNLAVLVLSNGPSSLEGMPACLPSLRRLDLSQCDHITSLKGISQMPRLEDLTLPLSIESLRDFPPIHHRLIYFNLAECDRLVSLKGMPAMRYLTTLILPSGLRGFQKMPRCLPSLRRLDLSRCSRITSFKGMAQMRKIREIALPKSTVSFECLFQQLEYLGELRNWEYDTVVSKLNILKLPKNFATLEGMSAGFQLLTELDLSECRLLSSLKGLPPLPSVKTLRLPDVGNRLQDLSDWTRWIRESPRWRSYVRPDGRLATLMPSLIRLHASSALDGLDDLALTLESVKTLRLRSLGANNPTMRPPPMPNLEDVWIVGSVRSLEWIAGFSDWAKYLHLEESKDLKSLAGIPRMARLQSIVLPSSIRTLDGIPEGLTAMYYLDLSRCESLKSMRGLPKAAHLDIILPNSAHSLELLPAVIGRVKKLQLSGSVHLTSLKGMPLMDWLKELKLPASIQTLEGMPPVLPALVRLNLSMCTHLQSLAGLSNLPSMEFIRPPSNLRSLEIASVHWDRLTSLSLQVCEKLESLEGFPVIPNLKTLVLPSSIRSLKGLPPILPRLRTLAILPCRTTPHNRTLLEGFPLMPVLENLDLRADIDSFQGMPPTLSSLRNLVLGPMLSVAQPIGLSRMPNLEHLSLSTEGGPQDANSIAAFILFHLPNARITHVIQSGYDLEPTHEDGGSL
ncbi:uncharacterized protein BJ171DRAFT_581606 [Polychytrium aggregatum]|uniref:uncharacterized protein n=1 Tax=Polychytrium aggregatum TaxID=110093 RepID=UPI0022FE0791|nr:uncharacterized protein BJ171DRAFT_581606 [Polychytrium aggregatum]KAI9204927.1 hypothetical protein BJ171DRAFT_581606 [Polychytrium aggregatum]